MLGVSHQCNNTRLIKVYESWSTRKHLLTPKSHWAVKWTPDCSWPKKWNLLEKPRARDLTRRVKKKSLNVDNFNKIYYKFDHPRSTLSFPKEKSENCVRRCELSRFLKGLREGTSPTEKSDDPISLAKILRKPKNTKRWHLFVWGCDIGAWELPKGICIPVEN